MPNDSQQRPASSWGRAVLRGLGVDLVRYPWHTTLNGHLRWLLRELHITTVIDVGANVGQFGSALRNPIRFSGEIISFEPGPDALTQLRTAASGDPKWKVAGYALGDQAELAQLSTFEGSDWNSMHSVDVENLARAGRQIQQTGTVQCEVRRLDAVWSEFIQPGAKVFLKSHTQGHDLRVLEGVGDNWAQVAGLQLYASTDTFYKGEPSFAEILRVASSYGFQPSAMYPLTRRKGSMAISQMDVCFVRVD